MDLKTPGFIDLQINGYLGVDFSSANLRADMIPVAFDAIVAGGTVGFLPTIITTAPEVYRRNLPMLARAMEAGASGGHALGIHLEGPFLCPEPGYIGAHPPSCARLPDPKFLGHLQELAHGKIKAMTMAAGLPGDSETAAAAQEMGIRVFLGHQRCTGEDLRRMAQAGAVALTHLGNGLPNDLNRFGNPLWAGLLAADLTAMLIADGHHVCDDLIRIMVQVKGPDKLVLVSDAAPIAGLPPGRYFTLGNEVMLEPSGYLYAIGKNCLAGSSANLLRCANYLASLAALSAEEIAAAATVRPLQLIGMTFEEVPDAGGRMVFNTEHRRFDWVR